MVCGGTCKSSQVGLESPGWCGVRFELLYWLLYIGRTINVKYLEKNVTSSFIILPAGRELDQQFNNTSNFVVNNAVITHGVNWFSSLWV